MFNPFGLEIIVPISGVVALLFALYLAWQINKESPGTDKMLEIYEAIRQGSKAYLARQTRTIALISIVLTVILYFVFDYNNSSYNSLPLTSSAFLIGAVCSLLAGYVGMDVATKANARTTFAAQKGVEKPLKIAFNGGLVMGLFNVGLSLLAVTGLFYIFPLISGLEITHAPELIVGLGFGASLAALFAQLGGGIYTKAADVGADLVGKVEAGIPEDDPRNPAVIADNVGDNVGDVAGRGADLFESMTAENIGAMIIGATLYVLTGNFFFLIFPLLARAIGIFGTIIGAPFVRGKNFSDPMVPLRNGMIVTTIFVIIALYFLTTVTLGSVQLYYAALSGVIASIVIFLITEYYTSIKYRPVKEITNSSESGPAINVISGFSVGLESTALPVIAIVVTILVGFFFGQNFWIEAGLDPNLIYLGGIYGTAVATMGMLSVAGMILGMDGFGPIVDNAAGIAEMSGANESVRNHLDKFDAAGNTTKSLTKGYALGSAGLAAILLFQAYIDVTHIAYDQIGSMVVVNLLDVKVLAGLFIGGLLPFLFSALAVRAVGRTAYKVVEEVRRQFKEIPGIMKGTAKPDYSKCVDISTIAALKEMILPGILPIIFPIVIGLTLGPAAVGALLISATVTGTLLAFLMNTGGAAWDNAKKAIELGALGGKGSDAHKAAVAGDTVGDPLKDCAGPSLHVLVKLINTVALTFGSLFVLLAIL